MSSFAQKVLDPYDDNRQRVQDFPAPLREFIEKTAEDLSGSYEYLGPTSFALVLQAPDDFGNLQEMKKFACVDAGNTLQSIVYFLQTYQDLPRDAVKVAARNLCWFAEDHGLQVPASLAKIAGEVNKNAPFQNVVLLADVPVKMAQVRPRQEPTEPSREDVPAMVDYFDQYATFMTGWEKRNLAQDIVKHASFAPSVISRYAGDDYASDLELGIFLRCGAVDTASEDEVELEKVAQLRDAYRELYGLHTQMEPKKFAICLEALDKMAGIHGKYGIPDAVYTTFGKTADVHTKEESSGSNKLIFEHGNVQLSEDELKELALRGHEVVDKRFGSHVADEFRKEPKKVFDTMPLPEKLVFARMAAQLGD